jgi:hypothetical protein
MRLLGEPLKSKASMCHILDSSTTGRPYSSVGYFPVDNTRSYSEYPMVIPRLLIVFFSCQTLDWKKVIAYHLDSDLFIEGVFHTFEIVNTTVQIEQTLAAIPQHDPTKITILQSLYLYYQSAKVFYVLISASRPVE